MQIKLYSIFLLLFLTLGLNHAYSQKSPAKFGKITKEHLEVTTCPIDADAHAYYIFDHGVTFFEYVTNKGFQTIYTRHFRIKIVDKKGLDWANIEQKLHHNEDELELLTKIRAFTYNLESGQVVKTKFDKKNIKESNIDKYWSKKEFAMPNVKVDSIIEVEYSVYCKLK